jgi:hypothetical protein
LNAGSMTSKPRSPAKMSGSSFSIAVKCVTRTAALLSKV